MFVVTQQIKAARAFAWVESVRARSKSQHSDLHGSPLEGLNGPLAAHFETVTAIRSTFEEAGIEVFGPLNLPVFASIGARCLKICRCCHELPGGPRLIALPATNTLCCDHLAGDMDPTRSIPDATVVEIRDVCRPKLSAALLHSLKAIVLIAAVPVVPQEILLQALCNKKKT
jgi:hypothetical protein